MPGRCLEVFERARDARAQLLKVERAKAAAEGRASHWLLTFDVGRIWLRRADGDGIEARHVQLGDELGVPLVDAREEEPWWRLLGNPLIRASATERELRLQFRADPDNPRIVTIAAESTTLAVSLTPGALSSE